MKTDTFNKSVLLGIITISGITLTAAPQISFSEAAETIVFSPQPESTNIRTIDFDETAVFPILNESRDLDVSVGQPLPGIGLTLLIGATCYSLRKRRSYGKQCGRNHAAVGREILSGNAVTSIFHKSIDVQYGAYWHQPIVLRL